MPSVGKDRMPSVTPSRFMVRTWLIAFGLLSFSTATSASGQLGEATILGKLVDETGRPLGGATIDVRAASDDDDLSEFEKARRFLSPEAPLSSQKSDSEGRFQFRNLRPGRHHLDVFVDGRPFLRVHDVAATNRPQQELVIRVRSAAVVKRWLLRPDGRPFAGQRIALARTSLRPGVSSGAQRAVPQLVETAADGSYETFDDGKIFGVSVVAFSPFPGVYVTVGRRGFFSHSIGKEEVLYDDGAKLTGTVVDGDGKPAVGFDVIVEIERGEYGVIGQVKTDAAGRYRFEGLPEGPINWLKAESPTPAVSQPVNPKTGAETAANRKSPLVLVRGENSADLELERVFAVRGVIKSAADGRPIAGCPMTVARSFGTLDAGVKRATTKADGTFEVSSLVASEKYVLSVMDEGSVIESSGPDTAALPENQAQGIAITFTADAAREDRPIEIKLRTFPSIEGRVVDRDDRPVPFARIFVNDRSTIVGRTRSTAAMPIAWSFGLGRSVLCDIEGRFVTRSLAKIEDLTFTAIAKGFESGVWNTAEKVDLPPVKIVLNRSEEPIETDSEVAVGITGRLLSGESQLSISGRVVADGQGAGGCEIKIVDADTNRPVGTTKTSDQGYFRATKLNEGRYILSLPAGTEYHVGSKMLRARAVRSNPVAAGTHGHQLIIASGLGIRGQAVSDKGTPIDGLTIEAFKVSGPGSSIAAAAAKIEKGAFALEGLGEGKYRFEIRGLFGKITETADAGAEDVKIVVPEPGKIRGRVLWSDKTPAKDALVWPRGFEGSVKADADGRFELPAVLPGRYKIIASIKVNGVDRFGETQKFDLAAGAVVDIGEVILEGSKH